MARLGIKRANGDIEYAELTTNKSLVGSHYLTVERYGTTYYAKLGDSVSTHLCVEGSDGKKLYVQKEAFTWKYIVNGQWDNASKMVIPRTGKYKLTYKNTSYKGVRTPKYIEEIKIKYDIFEQGAKFISYYNTNIMSKTNNKYIYYNKYSIDNSKGGILEIISTSLLEMEYIGEA